MVKQQLLALLLAVPCGAYAISDYYNDFADAMESPSMDQAMYLDDENAMDMDDMKEDIEMDEVKAEVKTKSVEILFLFMPGCPPCNKLKKEIPELERLVQDYGVVITMKDGTQSATQTWLQKQYKKSVGSFPTLFVIVDGVIQETLVGYRSAQALFNVIKKYVS